MIIYRYFLKELLPQFFTSFCVLSAVIVISQLVRLSDALITFGLSIENVTMPFLFILLPFLSFSIPMAYLFAVLLSFSRLSADGEYTALLASGYSLKKAAMPVLLVGAILYGVAAICSMNLEAWGRREMVQFYHRKAQTQLDHMIRVKMKPGVFLKDFLGYTLYAENISDDKTRFYNVMMVPSNKVNEDFTLLAPSAFITGSVESGDLRMRFDYGALYGKEGIDSDITIVKFKSAEIDILRIFQEQIFGADNAADDYRSFPLVKLWNYLDEIEHTRDGDQRNTWYKARFLFHQRIAMPFATIVFAMIGMVLGIQDERSGKSGGYIGAIAAIVGSYVLMMSFKFWSEQAFLSAPLAAWAPNCLLFIFGAFLLYQRNRLPPSESTLDLGNMPWRR
ncbi:MAG: hypothetical protein CMP10_06085 [Zetaproteobacteria bacterium]|mgnify:CR=1 FL=1|nr:hypothetical protein [Pseudobdellovibrionaceae bacterium]